MAALAGPWASIYHRRSFAPVGEGAGFGRRRNACTTSSAVTRSSRATTRWSRPAPRLAQDTTAYRKQGRVGLEGDHLCRAALERSVRPAVMAVFSESYWPQRQHEKALTAIKIVAMPDALFKDISGLGIAAGMGFLLGPPPSRWTRWPPRSCSWIACRMRAMWAPSRAAPLRFCFPAGAGRQRQCGPAVAQGVVRAGMG